MRARAIAKQLACAAAISSSGLVLPSGRSVRDAQVTGSCSSAPLALESVPWPVAKAPSQTTSASRVAIDIGTSGSGWMTGRVQSVDGTLWFSCVERTRVSYLRPAWRGLASESADRRRQRRHAVALEVKAQARQVLRDDQGGPGAAVNHPL